MAIVVDPLGAHRRLVQGEWRGDRIAALPAAEGLAFVGRLHPPRPARRLAGPEAVDAVDQADQQLVAVPLPVLDRAAAGLDRRALDHALGKLRRQLRRLQLGPGQLQGRAELLQHVRHAGIAAGQVEGQAGAHEGPAQAGAAGDGGVDLIGRRHAVGDQVQRLAPDRLLQAVGDVARDLAAHLERFLADGGVEGHGPLDRRGVGLVAAQHLDQGQEVDRVEGMADQDAPRPLGGRLNAARQQAGGAGGDHRVRAGRRVDARHEIGLEPFPLGRRFLDEVRALHRRLQAGGEAQPVQAGARRQADPFQRRPGVLDRGAQAGLGLRMGIVGHHIEAARQEIGGPAGADHAGADDRCTADLRGIATRHGELL